MTKINLLPLTLYLIMMLTPFNSIEPDGVLVKLDIIDSCPSETFLQFKERSKIEQLKTNSRKVMMRAIAKRKKTTKKSQFLTLLETNKAIK